MFRCVFILTFTLCNIGAQTQSLFTDPRDHQVYQTIALNGNEWFRENLRFVTDSSKLYDKSYRSKACGQFYSLVEAFTICPTGWRLPTEAEVKKLLKLEKRGVIDLVDTLDVDYCGRIDYGKANRQGEQNTYWIQVEMEGTYATHWHFFKDEIHMHHHNVYNKMFPVRCIR
ncbi:MAG: hypothetical protein Salg2KO_02190 [Salibacteraceae bacterium]